MPREAEPLLCTPDGRAVHLIHIAAELAPFARSGGLGEAVSSLARFQAESGLPVSIVMPLYDMARANAGDIEPCGAKFRVQVGTRQETVRLWKHRAPKASENTQQPAVYFIESEEYFNRPYLYGPPGEDYPDNARRYACFSAAALTAVKRIAPKEPVLVHVHDWHTALVPVYLRTHLTHRELAARSKVVLTVHNAGFQGQHPRETMIDLGLPLQLFNYQQFEWYGVMNTLKGGLVFADAVTTVSPTHAHELRTQAGGFGLDGVFVGLRDRFV